MTIIEWQQITFALATVFLVLLIARTLLRWNRVEAIPWAAIDLFSENGRASRGAFVMMGAFGATTFVFLYYALMHWLTDWMYIGYGSMWVVPVVARMLSSMPSSPSSPSSETLVKSLPDGGMETKTTTPAPGAKQ